MKNTVCETNQCNGCMACVAKCPKGCITIQDNLFAYNAVKDMDRCINCGQCEMVCPNCVTVTKKEPMDWKQGWAEWEIREHSSSGGAASAIIRSFIRSGGYVASCLFKEGQFLFDITNDEETAKKFAGSKYVKSNPAGIYQKVKDRLKTDKVLFIGLPCQIAGLKAYVNDSENLYTIDLICHGTPSPKLLEAFLKENKISLRECIDVKFRSAISFGIRADGRPVSTGGKDDYMIAFLDAVDYSENCYSCQFATFERVSDLTLGDSWGTEYKDEERNGISLILIQTEKGRKLVSAANMELRDVDIDIAKRDNHQLRHPSIRKPERDWFLEAISGGRSFGYCTFRLYKKQVIKRYIKSLLIVAGLKK